MFIDIEHTNGMDIVRISARPVLEKLFMCNLLFMMQYGRKLEQILAGDVPPEIVLCPFCDGAKQTNNRGMFLYALKIICRELASLILAMDYYNKDIQWNGVKSVKLVYLLGWLNGEDTIENNFSLRQLFFQDVQYWNRLGVFFNIRGYNSFFKIRCVICIDMKARQTITCVGGSSHFCTYFCKFCWCRNDSRNFPSFVRCMKKIQHTKISFVIITSM